MYDTYIIFKVSIPYNLITFEIFRSMQIMSFSTFFFILAVLKHKDHKIAATKKARDILRVSCYDK